MDPESRKKQILRLIAKAPTLAEGVAGNIERSSITWKMCRQLVESGLNVELDNVNCRADAICRFDGEMLDLLQAAGVRRLFVGLESGSDRILKMIDKGSAREHAVKANRVLAGHLPPDLQRGQQVDLYVTPDEKAVQRGRPAGARLVLAALTVADVVRSGGLGASGQDQPVVLSVAPEQVLVVVQALSEGRIDLVRVPRGAGG